MSTRDSNPVPDVDDDLATLFAAQDASSRIPAALDARIRAAAHQPLVKRADASQTTSFNTPFDKSNTRDATPPPKRDAATVTRIESLANERKTARPPRWLAAAAVVMLAAALVPIMRQAPDAGNIPSAPEASIAPEAASAPVAARTREASSAADAPATSSNTRSREMSESSVADISENPASESQPELEQSSLTRQRSRSDSMSAGSAAPKAGESKAGESVSVDAAAEADAPSSFEAPLSFVAPQADADDAIDFRASPDRWLAQIRLELAANGPTAELRKEYARFRRQYPDIQADFDVEALILPEAPEAPGLRDAPEASEAPAAPGTQVGPVSPDATDSPPATD